MALNLSRNTKVFVSSVNGVTASAASSEGGIAGTKDHGGSASGTYAIGDILTMEKSGESATVCKLVVLAVSSSLPSKLGIPNNFRGKNFAANDALVQTATTGSGTGFTCKVAAVSDQLNTAEGGRVGTGLFKGNEDDPNTFKIGVLDGYSFSQASESSDITVSEAGTSPNRSMKRFNDSLAPAEWSFSTYVRPFKHGTNSFRTSGTHDIVENILWAGIAGASITGDNPAGTASDPAVTCDSTDADVSFERSDHHELLKLNIFFALENTTYRLNDCQVNQVEIDFAIDGIATLNWSGNATSIDQVTTVIEDPSKILTCDSGSDVDGTNTPTNSEDKEGTYAEKHNYIDVGAPDDADYLRNKLSALTLAVDAAQGGGKSAGGLDAKTYSINITGGSITITNNITYLTPETLGLVDKPIGSFSGSRQMTGSLTCYLDTKSNGSNQLLSDLAAATSLVKPEFNMSLFMGNADSTTVPNVEFDIPLAMLSIPTIETADVISTTIEFAALGTGLDSGGTSGNDMSVKYKGSTTFSQDGYKATNSVACNADGTQDTA